MFIRKPIDALKSILKSDSDEKKNTNNTLHQQNSLLLENLSQEESLAIPHKSKE
jgi:hypothetical protein